MKAKKKRERGRKNEGWIKENGGVQYALIRHKGKRYCESSKSPNVTDAQALLDRMRRELRAGTYLPPRERAKKERAEQGNTVAKLADVWLETRIREGRNPKARKLAKARVETYLVPALGSKAIREVTRGDIRAYRTRLEELKLSGERKLSAQTVSHVLADCRCFFFWCEDEGYVERTPFPHGRKGSTIMPKVEELAPKALSDADALLVTSILGPVGTACRIMLGTGVRWGELVALQASDVQDGALVFTAPKTGKVRRIPVPPSLLRELNGIEGKLVPFGKDPKDYHRFLKTVRRISSLKSFGAHQLRHTFAYRWIWKGGSLSALQLVLGHAAIATTEIYAKPTDALVTRESERLWAQEPETAHAEQQA